jgi:hypothetical protein
MEPEVQEGEIHGLRQWLFWVALLPWLWYWGRWDECLQPCSPDDSEELMGRVGAWLAWHVLAVVGGVWAALETIAAQ